MHEELKRAAVQRPDRLTLQRLGEALLAEDKPHEAIIPLAAATGLSDHAQPAALLARALARVGRLDEARLIAQRILRRDPRNPDAMTVMRQLAA